ncbi:unnamed protein product [Sphagnum tenellum]
MAHFVTKRDGSKEPLDIDKIHKVVIWSTDGLSGVSASEVEIKSQIQFYPNIKTVSIQETLIKAASELISEAAPNYQYVAGRLINYNLRKEVYDGYNPCHIYELIKRNVASGFYDEALLGDYSEAEWDRIDSFIDHHRDMSLTYAAMEQLRGKYLVQNRVTGAILETPQMAYALIAATLFSRYPKETRLTYVQDYYEAISKHDISLPTPIMAGVRTPQRQFSSCTLLETDDSLESISATSAAIVKYVSQKAGIGIGAGRIRAIHSPVRKGDTRHTGVTPFFKHFQTAVRSCSQGSVRNGSATLFYPIFHMEIEEMLVLKNNKGTEETRIRQMDYGVQVNKLFYERLITGGEITLFSPHDVPEMYEAFFADYEKFKILYEAAERNPKIRKKKIKALELFSVLMQERKDTGRIYLMNVDNVNTHSSFIESKAPIRQSNLCMEVTLPTVPMGRKKLSSITLSINDLPVYTARWSLDGTQIKSIVPNDDGTVLVQIEEDASRMALCSLSAINWGNIKQPSDFEKPCRLAVRALDELLDYQHYPVNAARLATMEHRPLGVGIINLAYWLAKNGLKYSDGSALSKLDEYTEAWSYYLIRASVDLAKEKGACLNNSDTKYSIGLMPIDTRKIDVDTLVPHIERMPWAQLREDAKKYGIRNATVMNCMPAETSAQVANATNGIEPPRAYVSIKQSKDGVLKQVVPEFRRLKKQYELLWDQKSPMGYLNICALRYLRVKIMTRSVFDTDNHSDHMKSLAFFDPNGGVTIQRYDMMKYRQFNKLTKSQLGFFWQPEEIELVKDASDFKLLTDFEKHIFTSNLKRQILLDSVQGRSPNLAFLPICSLPEIEAWITAWSFSEMIHSTSYTHIIRNVYADPSKIFDEMTEIKEIVDCAKDISANYDRLIDLSMWYRMLGEGTHVVNGKTVVVDLYELKKALWMAINSVNILEGIRFYSSFSASWAFAELKKMEGNAKIIKLICMPGDHEILTETGWKKFPDLTKTEKVAQYNTDGTIEFVYPTNYIEEDFDGEVVRFKNKSGYFDVTYTPDHRVIYRENGVIKESTAENFNPACTKQFITSGKKIGVCENLSDLERFRIAVQADGFISDRYDGSICGTIPIDFHLKKERKIIRYGASGSYIIRIQIISRYSN